MGTPTKSPTKAPAASAAPQPAAAVEAASIAKPAASIAKPAVLRVTAAIDTRRRAGLAFSRTPRDLTEDDLGATGEEREERVKALFADPLLSVAPVPPAAEKPVG
jgi:hypothetical protein